MRPIVNSDKRIVQVTLNTVAVGTVGSVALVNVQLDPVATSPSQVDVGTVVKAIYAEVWVLSDGQQPSTVTTIIEKVPAGQDSADATQMGNLTSYTNKKNILEMHQGLVGDANANPIPFYRGWIKIPKGKQRWGIGDRLVFTLKSITEGTEFCGVFIFKAYN